MADLPTGTVTLLFTDIEGSTALLQRLGPRYADVLAEYRALLRAIFHAHDGEEVDSQGDSFFVSFPRALDAVQAAVAIHRSVASYSWPEGVTFGTRMGLHTGEPQRGSEGYVGLDVHRAARIGAVGHGGQVLLSDAARSLVLHDLPDGTSLRDLGEHRLKDLRHPRRLWQLCIAGLPTNFPPLKTLDSRPNNLPLQPTRFIGRASDMELVRDRLGDPAVRLVTLTGPGGIGKTRLALQVAAALLDDFPDGVWFVDLAPLRDATLLSSTIATVLGVKEAGGQSLLADLKAMLQTKQILLVLDNFEHVTAAAPLIADLLTAAAGLNVLVTSRVTLHLSGEHEVAVAPLPFPDPRQLPALDRLRQYAAVELFVQRAQAARADFHVTAANAPAVAAICARLDGLPLALELAAARIKLFPPDALLQRLAHRLRLLTGGARDREARQQTLRNTIDWSYNLLAPDEQRLLAHCGVFVGGCTIEAVEAICGDQAGLTVDVVDGLQSLVDKSLLRQGEGPDGGARFVMLDTLREYAVERLDASGDGNALRAAHAAYVLAFVEATVPAFQSQAWWGSQRWWDQVVAEHDNVRAALRWLLEGAGVAAKAEQALRLCVVMGGLWRRAFPREGRRWLHASLEAAHNAPTALRQQALTYLGWISVELTDFIQALAYFEAGLALARELGDRVAEADALRGMGNVAEWQGELGQAARRYEESLGLTQAVDDRPGVLWSLGNLAAVTYKQGDDERTETLVGEVLQIAQELEQPLLGLRFRLLRGLIAHRQGDDARALPVFRELLAAGWAVHELYQLPELFAMVAGAIGASGDPCRVARLYGAADAVRRSLDRPFDVRFYPDYEREVASARAQLDAATWDAAWAEGQAMPLEQAIAYALGVEEDGADDAGRS